MDPIYIGVDFHAVGRYRAAVNSTVVAELILNYGVYSAMMTQGETLDETSRERAGRRDSGLPSPSEPIESLDNDLASSANLKHRSGLALAAGLAALAFLFGYSLVPLIFHLRLTGAISDSTFLKTLPLPRVPAIIALLLGIAAWLDLRRRPYKSGRLLATLGLIIGFLGTLILLYETYEVVRALSAIK